MSEVNFVSTEENGEVEQNLEEETRRSAEKAHENLLKPRASDWHPLVYNVSQSPEQTSTIEKTNHQISHSQSSNKLRNSLHLFDFPSKAAGLAISYLS